MITIAQLGSYDMNIGDNIALYNIRKEIERRYDGEIKWNNIEIKDFHENKNLEDYCCKRYDKISEENDFLIIGGGGLIENKFDYANGFKIPISEKSLKHIKIPIICFGVGVNTFRLQTSEQVKEGNTRLVNNYEFSHQGIKTLRLLVNQSSLFSVRDDCSYYLLTSIISSQSYAHSKPIKATEEQRAAGMVDFVRDELDTKELVRKVYQIPDPGLMIEHEMDAKEQVKKGFFEPAWNKNPAIMNARYGGDLTNTNYIKKVCEINNLKLYPHCYKDYYYTIKYKDMEYLTFTGDGFKRNKDGTIDDVEGRYLKNNLKDIELDGLDDFTVKKINFLHNSFAKPEDMIISREDFDEFVLFNNTDKAFDKYLDYDYACVMRGHGQIVSVGMNLPAIYFSTQEKVAGFSRNNGFNEYTVDTMEENWENKLFYLISSLKNNKNFLKNWYNVRAKYMEKANQQFDVFCAKVIELFK